MNRRDKGTLEAKEQKGRRRRRDEGAEDMKEPNG